MAGDIWPANTCATYLQQFSNRTSAGKKLRGKWVLKQEEGRQMTLRIYYTAQAASQSQPLNTRVTTTAQKSGSPIGDTVGQNNCLMQ